MVQDPHAAAMNLQIAKILKSMASLLTFTSLSCHHWEDLLNVVSDSLRSGRLPLSCRRAIINLLAKTGDIQEH